MKLYLSPSNQPANVYVNWPTNEKREMEYLALHLKEFLEKYNGVEVIMADFDKSIVTRPKEARDKWCDLYLALHSNAGGTKAKGPIAMYHPDQPSMKILGTDLTNALVAISPHGTDRANPVYSGMAAFDGAGYAEIREPYRLGMRTLLLEVDFHSNPVTASYIVTNKKEIAWTIGRTLVQTYGWTVKEEPLKYLYKVQTGAFSTLERAQAMAEDLKKAGFPVYIKKEEQA